MEAAFAVLVAVTIAFASRVDSPQSSRVQALLDLHPKTLRIDEAGTSETLDLQVRKTIP